MTTLVQIFCGEFAKQKVEGNQGQIQQS